MHLKCILIFACLIFIADGKRYFSGGGSSSRGSFGSRSKPSPSFTESIYKKPSIYRSPSVPARPNNFANTGVGWKIPDIKRTSNVGSNLPKSVILSRPNTGIGWKIPDIKRETSVGSNARANLPNTGIGWKVPDIKRKISVGSNARANLPNTGIGWKIPDIKRETNANTGIGWKIPDIKRGTENHQPSPSSSYPITFGGPFGHLNQLSEGSSLFQNTRKYVAKNNKIPENPLFKGLPNNTKIIHQETPKTSLFDLNNGISAIRSFYNMFTSNKQRAYTSSTGESSHFVTPQAVPAQVFYDNAFNNAQKHKIINYKYLIIIILVMFIYV